MHSSQVKHGHAKRLETSASRIAILAGPVRKGEIMTKTMMALATAAALAVTAVAAPAPAEARGGRVAAGVIGGLAAGALIGGAIASSRPAYAYPPGYYAPGYAPAPAYYGPGPGCYWTRERFWDGYGWRSRRVQVC